MSERTKSQTCQHRAYQCFNGGQTICKDCGEVFKSPQELRATRRPVIRQDFNEADCGGVFGADGQVHSDADPGL